MKLATNSEQKKNKNQKGTVAVEFAIMLTALAILLLGTFEVGSIAHDYQILQNSAREGARFSSQNPSISLQTIQDRVVAYLTNEKITVSDSDVTVDQAYPIQIGDLTVMGSHVTVAYKRPLIFPGVTTFIPSLGSFQLNGSAIFRNLY